MSKEAFIELAEDGHTVVFQMRMSLGSLQSNILTILDRLKRSDDSPVACGEWFPSLGMVPYSVKVQAVVRLAGQVAPAAIGADWPAKLREAADALEARLPPPA